MSVRPEIAVDAAIIVSQPVQRLLDLAYLANGVSVDGRSIHGFDRCAQGYPPYRLNGLNPRLRRRIKRLETLIHQRVIAERVEKRVKLSRIRERSRLR